MLPRLLAVAESQFGVFSRQQALAAGYSEGEIRARRRSRTWRQLRRGVYSAQPQPDSSVGRHLEACAATCLVRPDLVVSHDSAALLHGLVVIKDPDRPTFLTRDGCGSTRSGIHVREGALGPNRQLRLRHMVITTAAQTVVDIASTSTFRDAVATADSALRLGKASREDLIAVTDEMASAVLVRRALRVVEFTDGRSESAGESLTRVLLDDGRLPKPQLNADIGPTASTSSSTRQRDRRVRRPGG